MGRMFTLDIKLRGFREQELKHHKLCDKSWLQYRVKAINTHTKNVEKGRFVGS